MTPVVVDGPAHAAALAALHLDAEGTPPWNEAAFGAVLCHRSGFAVLAPDGGGFALARVAAEDSELILIAVVPARRRLGLGRALLRCAMDGAVGRGARAMFLEVAPSNAAACRLYDRAGFGAVGRRPRYYEDGEDAVLMRRTLTPSSSGCGAG